MIVRDFSPSLAHKPLLIFSFPCSAEEGWDSDFGGHLESSQGQLSACIFHILLFLPHPVGPVQFSAAIKQVSIRIPLDISADLIKLLLWFSLSIGKLDEGLHY